MTTVKRRLERVESAMDRSNYAYIEDLLRAIDPETPEEQRQEILNRPLHPGLEKALRDLAEGEPGDTKEKRRT